MASFKSFPHTIDGEQIMLEFETREELEAFNAIVFKLDALTNFIVQHERRLAGKLRRDEEIPLPDYVVIKKDGHCISLEANRENLLTSLQVQILMEHFEEICRIVGVQFCGSNNTDSVLITRCRE